jgi:hypothetical protein
MGRNSHYRYHRHLAGYRKHSLETRPMASTEPGKPCFKIEECDFTIIETTQKLNPLDYYKQLREYVEHENHLMHVRITWLLTIHGFLFASYGLTLQKLVDILKGLHATDLATLPLFAFQLLICWMGTRFSSRSATDGIRAAQSAIDHIDTIAQAQAGLLKLTTSSMPVANSIILPRIIGGGMKRPWSGADASLIPFSFKQVWVLLFVFSVLFSVLALGAPFYFTLHNPVSANSAGRQTARSARKAHQGTRNPALATSPPRTR